MIETVEREEKVGFCCKNVNKKPGYNAINNFCARNGQKRNLKNF